MKSVFIVSAKRTPIGSFLGSLSSLSASELGAVALQACLEESGVPVECLDGVVLGHVLTAGAGMGTARQASLLSKIPETVPAYSVNMVCGSGMKAIMEGALSIMTGASDVILAGGMESMSNAPFIVSSQIRQGQKMGSLALVDSILGDGLTDAFCNIHMGITAENIAKQLQITRKEQDTFAFQSQQKTSHALNHGLFEKEIIPVTTKQTIIKIDEHPRPTTTEEQLASLAPAFVKEGGTVTAGNASGINDGAAAMMLASQEAIEKYQFKPLAKILSFGQGGVSPEIMGLAPVIAIQKALQSAKMTLNDLERIELNEAFAVQVLGCVKQLIEQENVDADRFKSKLNPTGGAIALGHPVGASGTRILVTLLHGMQRNSQELGLASLCIGGGMGIAIVVQAV